MQTPMRALSVIFFLCTLSACLFERSEPDAEAILDLSGQKTSRSHTITQLNDFLYFTSLHTNELIKWDVSNKQTVWKKEIGAGGARVSIDESHQRLFSAATDEGLVYVHNLNGEQLETINAVQQPVGVLWLPVLKHLLVTDQALNQLIVFNEQLKEVSRIDINGAPRGIAYDAINKRIIISCFLSDKFSSLDVSAEIINSSVQLNFNNIQYHRLNFKARLAQNIEIYKQQVLIPHAQSNHEKINLVFDNVVAPRMSAFNLNDLTMDTSRVIAIDTLDRTVNQPNDIAVDTQTGDRWVLNSGTNDISIISDAPSKRVAHIYVAKKPISMLLDSKNRRAYVFNSLSYSISEIDMDNHIVLAEYLVTVQTVSNNIQLGMEVFFLSTDERVSKDKWVTCAICHPDGKQDGLIWQQGLGPRNTTSMEGLINTGQLHWSGNRDEVQDFEHTFRNLMGGTGFISNPPNELAENIAGQSIELDALANFIFSIPFTKPLKPHFLNLESVARGKAIFSAENSGCLSCHTGDHFTKSARGQQNLDNVGTQTRTDDMIEANTYDTASLKGLAFSAPYLHDGSAANLEDVISDHNEYDQHGVTQYLNSQEKIDLVEFLKSL